jgi:hypothetical protein
MKSILDICLVAVCSLTASAQPLTATNNVKRLMVSKTAKTIKKNTDEDRMYIGIKLY